jgi:hypothetical protein
MLPELSFAFAFSQDLKTDGQEIPHLVSSFMDPGNMLWIKILIISGFT